MKVITTEKIPVKMWLDEIEDGALAQIRNLANLPFAFKHIAIMPDSHQGYGMPIGGVLATKGVVIPNAVGVDIGCGMCAVKLNITDIETDKLKAIMGDIRKAIPVGFNRHKEAQDELLMPDVLGCDVIRPIVTKEYASALNQIGTLGGGNHFIEIQQGSDGYIWVMIHSGSRNFGLQIAEYYNKKAIELNEQFYSVVDKKQELAFLPLGSDLGKAYMAEMQYAVDFSLANRKLMMDRIGDIFRNHFDVSNFNMINVFPMDNMINIAHNYAAIERHFGQDVMVHRKGATLASTDTIGIIPGSQGTKSYIVRGKGNKDSFTSCSHGAGRKMGRGEATRQLNLADEIKRLDDQGIIHGIRTIKDLDEASGAYKDINVVMENQKDLVEILVELTPLAVIKG